MRLASREKLVQTSRYTMYHFSPMNMLIHSFSPHGEILHAYNYTNMRQYACNKLERKCDKLHQIMRKNTYTTFLVVKLLYEPVFTHSVTQSLTTSVRAEPTRSF